MIDSLPDILWDEVLGRGSLLGRFLLLRGNLLNDPLALFPFTLHLSDPLLLRMSPRLLIMWCDQQSFNLVVSTAV